MTAFESLWVFGWFRMDLTSKMIKQENYGCIKMESCNYLGGICRILCRIDFVSYSPSYSTSYSISFSIYIYIYLIIAYLIVYHVVSY